MQALENLTEILVPIAFFSAVVLSLFFYFRARNQVKLSLIEKGLYNTPKPKNSDNHRSLKIGIFCIGIATGIFIGSILGRYTSINPVVAFFTMIILFGGISLVVNQFIGAKLSKSDK